MMHLLKLYFIFMKAAFQDRLQDRFYFIINTTGTFVSYGAEFLMIWLIVDRFNAVGDWSAAEVMVLFALNLTSYAIAGFFFNHSTAALSEHINSGRLDQVLTKPQPVLYTLIVSAGSHIGYISHIGLSFIVLVFALNNLGISLISINIVHLIVSLIGAALIQGSILLISGTINFWAIQGGGTVFGLIWTLRDFVKYPLSIYPVGLQVLLTFVIPLGFISYYPAHSIIGRDDVIFSDILTTMTPVVGIIFFVIALGFWTIGLRHYKSTGS